MNPEQSPFEAIPPEDKLSDFVTSSGVPTKEKYKKLIHILAIISIIVSIYSTHFVFSNLSRCSDLCIGNIPLLIPTLPVQPAISHISSFDLNSHIIISSPSIFKFYAFFVVFLNMALVATLTASIFIYKRNRRELNITTTLGHKTGKFLLYSLSSILISVLVPWSIILLAGLIFVYLKNKNFGNFKKDFMLVATKIGVYLLITFLLLSFVHLIVNPPHPLSSNHKVLSFCGGKNNECLYSYISASVPNCAGKTTIFLYPFTKNINQPDTCSFDNFIKTKPFTNSILSENKKLSDRDYCTLKLGIKPSYSYRPEKEQTPMYFDKKTHTYEPFILKQTKIEAVFDFFENMLNTASKTKLDDFCNSFNLVSLSSDTNEEVEFVVNPYYTTITKSLHVDELYTQPDATNSFTVDFTINSTGAPVPWKTSVSEKWVDISPSSGVAAGGGNITVHLNKLLYDFPPGSYAATITFLGDFSPQTITILVEVYSPL